MRWDLPRWPLAGEPLPPGPPRPTKIETFTVATNKALLHPAKRAELRSNGDVALLQVLALGHHAASGDPTLDIGVVDGDYGPRTQAAAPAATTERCHRRRHRRPAVMGRAAQRQPTCCALT